MCQREIFMNSYIFLFLFMCLCIWLGCVCVMHLWRHTFACRGPRLNQGYFCIGPPFYLWGVEYHQIQSMLIKATLASNLAPSTTSEHWNYRWSSCPQGILLGPKDPIQSSTFAYLASIINTDSSLYSMIDFILKMGVYYNPQIYFFSSLDVLIACLVGPPARTTLWLVEVEGVVDLPTFET